MDQEQYISNHTGYTQETENLYITIQGMQYTVPLKDILYFESNLRKVIIHTTSKNYEYYEKLDTLEQLLHTKGFVRCHQSYLVAVACITSYSDTNLTINEKTLPISRSRLEYIRHILQDTNADYCQTPAKEYKQRPNSYLSSASPLSSNTSLFPEEEEENSTQGVITCIEGIYKNATLWLQPDKSVIIGRTIHAADVVINLPMVSRVHCEITYHQSSHTYEIIDYSANGTYINREFRLVPKIPYMLNPGTIVSFGDQTTLYELG